MAEGAGPLLGRVLRIAGIFLPEPAAIGGPPPQLIRS
jgi:hypothetical protein